MTAAVDMRTRLRLWAERDGRGYPDWLMRYGPLVRRWQPRPGMGAVIEIGANAAGFSRFAAVETMVLDLEWDNLLAARAAQPVQPMQADIVHLPLTTGSAAMLVCLDTFEHLPPTARPMAIGELIRCMAPAGRLVVSFPSGDSARQAEQRIRDEYRRHAGLSLRWLEEHDEYGLPDAHEMLHLFQGACPPSHRVTLVWNANARVWLWMWRVLICGWPGRGNVVFQVVLRMMSPALARCHFGPCYRAMIFVEPHGS